MYALQDYIDAQFGGPGKGFLRIVKTPHGGAQGDQRRQAGDGARRRGLRGPQLRADSSTSRTAPPRRSTPSSTSSSRSACSRCSRCTSSTTRSAARSTTRARPACSSTPATSTPPASSGTPSTATTADHDNEPTNPTGAARRAVLRALRARCSTHRCSRDSCRSIRRRRSATRRGLTALGEFMIRSMMRRGMIIETDHLSVKARRDVLDIIEARQLSRRDLEPQLGRPGQPEAHPAASAA